MCKETGNRLFSGCQSLFTRMDPMDLYFFLCWDLAASRALARSRAALEKVYS